MSAQRVIVDVPVIGGQMRMFMSLRAASVINAVAGSSKNRIKVTDLTACWPGNEKPVDIIVAKINSVLASRKVGSRIQLHYRNGSSYLPHRHQQLISWSKHNPKAGTPASISLVIGRCNRNQKPSRKGAMLGFVPELI